MTTSFADSRFVKRLAFAVAAVAVWLGGADSTARAGCGDYLVGVEQTGDHHAAPMTPHHDSEPQCRSCNQPASPITPAAAPERLPVEQAVSEVRSSLLLERSGWDRVEVSPRCQTLSLTLDRPPKV